MRNRCQQWSNADIVVYLWSMTRLNHWFLEPLIRINFELLFFFSQSLGCSFCGIVPLHRVVDMESQFIDAVLCQISSNIVSHISLRLRFYFFDEMLSWAALSTKTNFKNSILIFPKELTDPEHSKHEVGDNQPQKSGHRSQTRFFHYFNPTMMQRSITMVKR